MGNKQSDSSKKQGGHSHHEHNHSDSGTGCCSTTPTQEIATNSLEDAVSKTKGGAGNALPVSLLEKGGKLTRLLAPSSFNPRFISMISEVFSPDSPGYIYVVAQTESYDNSEKPVQFLMMLHGLAHIGHRVVIHNAAENELELVAEEADVVIVDNASKNSLPPNFKEAVLKVAPNADFFVSEADSLNLKEWN